MDSKALIVKIIVAQVSALFAICFSLQRLMIYSSCMLQLTILDKESGKTLVSASTHKLESIWN